MATRNSCAASTLASSVAAVGNLAKFNAIVWEGDVGWGNGLHYHDDVANAFAVAGSVAAVISNCQATAKTVIAHSLGNMVACSAFCDHGMEADRYIMLNAAVPAEAIDANAFNDSTNANPMVHHQWHGYEPRTWAAKWHELFAGNDDRSKLTWRGRFGPMLNKPAGFLSNFYSSGDEVLSLHTNVNGHGMVVVDAFSGSTPRIHSWQKQEYFKGR